jgi:hypothetical protein
MQVFHLFAQQDPCSGQIHENGPFFLALRALRHLQAFRRVTLEIDQAAHLHHPAYNAIHDYKLRQVRMLSFSLGKFVTLLGPDWGAAIVAGSGARKQNSQTRQTLTCNSSIPRSRSGQGHAEKTGYGPCSINGIG